MPSPPFVIASSAPCEAAIKKKSTHCPIFSSRLPPNQLPATMPATAANKTEWSSRDVPTSPRTAHRTQIQSRQCPATPSKPSPLSKTANRPAAALQPPVPTQPLPKNVSECSASSSAKSSSHHPAPTHVPSKI